VLSDGELKYRLRHIDGFKYKYHHDPNVCFRRFVFGDFWEGRNEEESQRHRVGPQSEGYLDTTT
jgi:hypothetical protein